MQEDYHLELRSSPRSHNKRAQVCTRASKSFVYHRTAKLPRRHHPQALEPPMQDKARVQTTPSPQHAGLYRRRQGNWNSSDCNALCALEGPIPVSAQTKRTRHYRHAGSGEGRKDSTLLAYVTDLSHQMAKHAHLQCFADKDGWKEGNRRELGAGITP